MWIWGGPEGPVSPGPTDTKPLCSSGLGVVVAGSGESVHPFLRQPWPQTAVKSPGSPALTPSLTFPRCILALWKAQQG